MKNYKTNYGNKKKISTTNSEDSLISKLPELVFYSHFL